MDCSDCIEKMRFIDELLLEKQQLEDNNSRLQKAVDSAFFTLQRVR